MFRLIAARCFEVSVGVHDDLMDPRSPLMWSIIEAARAWEKGRRETRSPLYQDLVVVPALILTPEEPEPNPPRKTHKTVAMAISFTPSVKDKDPAGTFADFASSLTRSLSFARVTVRSN